MERLTVRDSRQHAWFNNDGVLIRGANGTFHQKKDMTAHYIHDRFVAFDKVIDHLASFEDIGMEPEEVVALRASFEALRDEAIPLLQAKTEDKLVILPCRVGDTVYVIAQCEWVKRRLDGTLYGANGELGTATGYYCAFEGREEDCPLAAGREECDQNGFAIFEEIVDSVGAVYNEVSGTVEPFVCTENLVQFFGDKVYLTRAEAEAALAAQKEEPG